MLNLGMSELLAFGIIALLVLGPDKLPEAARFVGKWYAKIKRTVSNVQNDIDRELRLSELREQMQQEMQRIAELEQKMQAQMTAFEQQKVSLQEDPQKAATQKCQIQVIYHFILHPLPVIYLPKIALLHASVSASSLEKITSVPELKVAV
ncbi:Twin-arginine translocation protein TatB [Acinetobacter haemolyticus CIP 64.3 = MTCC 9819]|uniref:Sec-independent protein translocase protein TatB n=1 Tax=Acinetobacter haemolyticus CIP 64.3 = MTCC 9819 TaxID=1217659 RepID=N9GMA1_ACIHA|nr:Sec-independent protein translocase protein TatB [Acinetobacter haemolyticus]ENW20615.1 twin arginine-targeting protein translocase TatB [Acinetobacter haemolyticus CIP 64.3 = MTCC 9819]EPR89401.1 Twin-arginine translocation protein TatB [Acinetobacter haemolyticus CIP 64.3 = MTCC 9819]QXZ27995.1 Sec-independent protein translocase protein TatB [Acinetobacter haemolyticus]SPT47583.1 sec-independent protein translocase protein [Acinetobacter haemolyticus]SUU55443.1 sec-independent protein tr